MRTFLNLGMKKYVKPIMRNRSTHAITKRSLFAKFKPKFVTITVSLIASTIGVAYYLNDLDENKIKNVLNHGNTSTSNTLYFKRPNIDATLASYIVPNSNTSGYFIITGESGVGKSATIKNLSTNCGGVIYIQCSEASKFGRDFATCTGCDSIYQRSFLRFLLSKLTLSTYIDTIRFTTTKTITNTKNEVSNIEEFDTLNYDTTIFQTAIEKIEKYCQSYTTNTKKIPVIIIDNIDRFCETDHGKRLLIKLQQYAKLKSASNELKIVFVTNNVQVLQCFYASPDINRATIITIPDVTADEAYTYLTSSLTSSVLSQYSMKHIKTTIQDVTGGRFSDLVDLKNAMNCSIPLEEFSVQKYMLAHHQLTSAGWYTRNNSRQLPLWNTINTLNMKSIHHDNKKYMYSDSIHKLYPYDNIFNHIITHPLFTYDMVHGTISFKSRALQTYLHHQRTGWFR